MTRDKIKEGDICTLDESVEYSYNPHKPYEVVVLWHGVNSQPLVTKLDTYKPFWVTYSQLIEVKRHIDLSIKVLEQQTCEDAVSRQAVLDIFADNADAVRPYSKTWEEVKALPPVNPQRTGHWKEVYAETDYRNGWIEFSCENCEYQHGLEIGEYGWSYGDPIPWKYCPICGAKMVEPQESEG